MSITIAVLDGAVRKDSMSRRLLYYATEHFPAERCQLIVFDQKSLKTVTAADVPSFS